MRKLDGARIGRFEIVRLLGAGGMGAVYEARDPELARSVALKLIHEPDPRKSVRLIREAQALAQLQHPNVVAVHEVGTDGEEVFVAMELVDGTTVDKVPASWREVVAMFVQAGRGLVAAHAKGLVHRDIKPSNLLVDQQGRVRVGDFGLARTAPVGGGALGPPVDTSADTVDASAPGTTRDAPAADGVLLDAALTSTGALVGTPKYMAPELFQGAPATAASDQYGFCVALRELVPDGAPGWVTRAIERGTAKDPEERHPSMEALVELLDRTPVRRRTRALAAAGAAVVAAAIAGAVIVSREPRAGVRCAKAGDAFGDVWTSALRAEAHPSVATALDLHATRWRDLRVEACRATHERGEQSAALLDRRMRCLDRQLETARAMLGAVEVASVEALEALDRLPDPRACNAARLVDAVPIPDDPRAAEIERQLDAIAAARTAGDEATARALVDGALAVADDLGHPGLRANVLWEQGNLLAGADPAASKQILERSLAEAIDAGDVEQEAAAIDDLLVLAVQRGEVPPIEAMLPVAQAVHRREGVSARRRGAFHKTESQALLLLGRHDDALAACDRLGQVEDRPQVETTDCRCNALYSAARDAVAACREAAEVAEATFGPDHPSTASRLGNLSNAMYRAGDYSEMQALEERVLAIREKAFGPASAEVAHILFSLTTTYRELGKLDESRAAGERSLAIFEQLGLTAWAAKVHGGLGQTMSRLKDPAATITHADEALRLNVLALGADHPDMALHHGIHAVAHAEVGNDAIAAKSFARCAEIAAASYGPSHPLAGQCALGEAETLVNLRRFREAVARVEHVMASAETAGFRKENLPAMKEIYGRALWGAGDKKRARKELDEALAGFREIGDQGRVDALQARMRTMR